MRLFQIVFILVTFSGHLNAKKKEEGFKGFSSNDLHRSMDSSCVSGVVLEKAINLSGLNILDNDTRKMWTCYSGGPYRKDCPPRLRSQRDNPICYSESDSSIMCITNLRSFKYEGENTNKEIRFDSIWLKGSNPINNGQKETATWLMDSKGCNPIVYIGKRTLTVEECVQEFHSLMSGGDIGIFSIGQKRRSRKDSRYCDSRKLKDYTHSLRVEGSVNIIAKCSEVFPNLVDKYQEFHGVDNYLPPLQKQNGNVISP